MLRLGPQLLINAALSVHGRRPNIFNHPARDRLGLFFPTAGGWSVQLVLRFDQLVCGGDSQDRYWGGIDDPEHRAGNA